MPVLREYLSCRSHQSILKVLDQTTNNTSQQGFGTRKIYCVSNVTFHVESKYAIKIFPSPTVFYTMAFLIIDFSEFLVFSSVIFLYMNKYFKWF